MAAALPFISTAFAAIGAISGANANAASLNSQANAQQYNATVERQRADAALQQGNAQEELQRRQARVEAGRLRAGLVENGLALDSGTGADLVNENSVNSEMDALNIRYNAQMNAKGYKDQAVQDEYGATVSRANASAAKKAGYMGAAGAVLTGAGNYYTGVQNKKLYNAQMKYYGA